MDIKFVLKKENPLKTSNFASKLLFLWMMKLCYTGTKRSLQIADLYKTLTKDKSEFLVNKLEENWKQELLTHNTKPSLLKVLIKTFIWQYLIFGIGLFIQIIIIRSFQPLVLAYFIKQFKTEETNYVKMYTLALILIVQSLLRIFLTHHIEFGQAKIGMHLRVSLSSLVYRKTLKLNKTALDKVASGQVINLLSNDVQRFDAITSWLHYLWLTPIQAILITYLMWNAVGVSAFAGVLALALLTLPFQNYLGKLTARYRLQIAECTDTRINLTNEVLSGIQLIKMYAWEVPFKKMIKQVRNTELSILTKSSYLKAFLIGSIVYMERTTLYLTVITYALLGNTISADKVFSLAQFFNMLQDAMAGDYLMTITLGAETLVSIKRLQAFLLLDEKNDTFVTNETKTVSIKNVTASWSSIIPIIKNVSFKVTAGSLCALVGAVGSGKSSILQLLLGEMAIKEGEVAIGGKVAYVSQEPWLFVSNVRNNIVFTQVYNAELYGKVVHACALKSDFAQFLQGDGTVVGENGVLLSGGQKGRIGLARALYQDADIYLLDDPFSAVDAQTSRHLFDECVVKYLKSKTRILVTHQLEYLKKVDLIVVVNNGTIEAQGSFDQLSTNQYFNQLLMTTSLDSVKDAIKYTNEEEDLAETCFISKPTDTLALNIGEEENLDFKDSKPFKDYVKASGNCCAVFSIVCLLILAQLACNCADYWITFWTSQEAAFEFVLINSTIIGGLYEEVLFPTQWFSRQLAIYVYTGLILASILLTLLRSFAVFKMAMIASSNLHTKMFNSLLEAPMRFFDMNPSGRILNRFSKDMGAIDEVLPRTLMETVQVTLVMIGILVLVAIANWYMIIAMVLIGGFFVKVRKWYMETARDVKHLEAIAKSPIFSHVNSSLNGITQIRAIKAELELQNQFDYHQDNHTSAWFLTIATRVSFGLWLDLISVFFISVVIFSFIVLSQAGRVDGSLVGLAISQSLILTGMVQDGMRQSAEVINQLTSVERVMQYTKLPNEESTTIHVKNKKLHKEWPSTGLIEFRNVSMKYSESDSPVLRNLNFVVRGGYKIGIVGRTGAGKSSLISALFRLAPLEGAILIDGVNTKHVPLFELRKKISIIPQEPVLFSATLRTNLDPFGEFSDEHLWQVVEDVELKDAVSSLDFMVSQGGSNFSLGQRQLICLARAILRNNKILVLDEATANVDPQTDALIQKTIREKFSKCTVLTIAHRLNTIMDSDMVFVMGLGQMLQYNHPHILLQDNESDFAKMVAETGPTMTQQLKDISHRYYLTGITK